MCGGGGWSKPFEGCCMPALGHSHWEVLFRCRERERVEERQRE